MVDLVSLDRLVDTLVMEGRNGEAEALLLKHYASAKSLEKSAERVLLLDQLIHFYLLVDMPDAAEQRLLEAESLAEGDRSISGQVYRKTQTALLYFWTYRDFGRTIAKTSEIPPRAGLVPEEEGAYYTAQTLKGHALLELGRLEESEHVLDELSDLIRHCSRCPLGDEMNFLGALSARRLFSAKCAEVLRLLRSKIRDDEYRRRASRLLQQITHQSG